MYKFWHWLMVLVKLSLNMATISSSHSITDQAASKTIDEFVLKISTGYSFFALKFPWMSFKWYSSLFLNHIRHQHCTLIDVTQHVKLGIFHKEPRTFFITFLVAAVRYVFFFTLFYIHEVDWILIDNIAEHFKCLFPASVFLFSPPYFKLHKSL